MVFLQVQSRFAKAFKSQGQPFPQGLPTGLCAWRTAQIALNTLQKLVQASFSFGLLGDRESLRERRQAGWAIFPFGERLLNEVLPTCKCPFVRLRHRCAVHLDTRLASVPNKHLRHYQRYAWMLRYVPCPVGPVLAAPYGRLGACFGDWATPKINTLNYLVPIPHLRLSPASVIPRQRSPFFADREAKRAGPKVPVATPVIRYWLSIPRLERET